MKTFLGVDGGGTHTRFVLIDEAGRVLASHLEGPAYYPEIGLDQLREMLARGIGRTLRQGHVREEDLSYAFLGLPAYGEGRKLLPALDAAPLRALPHGRYRCGNDMVCGWAGALAGADGINIVAGTGSIAYGEYRGRSARAGGWGELFSDEGSAYWVAREGLQAFTRMADGRLNAGPLHAILRRHFAVEEDLDICGAVYGDGQSDRSRVAQLAPLIAQAAEAGDPIARDIFSRAAQELAAIVYAVRDRLQVPPGDRVTVSHSGGMFNFQALLLTPLRDLLTSAALPFDFAAPLLPPDAGAALYAAGLAGIPLSAAAISTLRHQLASAPA